MKPLYAGLVLICALNTIARADDGTTIGVTVNGTTGAHIESQQSESIPFLPLPTIRIDSFRDRFTAHLEIMPPIGPVPLAQGGSFFPQYSKNPRVSYVSGELGYQVFERYEAGIGETILNQQTQYPPMTIVTASRVVGMRLFAAGPLYERDGHGLYATFSTSPEMRGLQDGHYGEQASLIDSSLYWSTDEGPYVFDYGVRYVNYTALYTDRDELADRNHLFMPFIAMNWKLGAHARPASTLRAEPQQRGSGRDVPWHAGVTLLGTNGSRAVFNSPSVTSLPFSLVPLFSAQRDDSHSTFAFEAIVPNQSSNIFGSLGQVWSYLNADALARLGSGRYGLGFGETIVNLQEALPPPHVEESGRSEGLHATATAVLARSLRSTTSLRVAVSPYLHLRTITEYNAPDLPHPISLNSVQHGSRIDTSLTKTLAMRGYALAYGLRYINQATNYGRGDLTRSSSLMPFAGVNLPW